MRNGTTELDRFTLPSRDGDETSEVVPVIEAGGMRRSVEVEYWVVDTDGTLTGPGDLVSASPGVEREFVEPLLEIKTTPCSSSDELRGELLDRLEAVLDRAEDLGKRLVPLATPVRADEIAEIPSERTRIQNEIVGEDFQYVRHCAGTHVHFEQQPGHTVDQFNVLVALDPAFAAVNSSPYFRGRRLAAGARSKLYRDMAYDTVPHQGKLWRYLADQREWARRLERRYEEFLTAASEAGVDRSAVYRHFDPESAIWTPVQLRDRFGTVEWRSPDTALPSQVLRLADDLVGVVERAVDTEVRIGGNRGYRTETETVLPEFDTVVEHVNGSIRLGLESDTVRTYLDRMGIDPDAYEPITTRFDQRGRITEASARRLRLEYADRLEADVRSRSALRAD
ncbi:Glutamate-cysteine ligase family 2(GCS2) [Halapricum desulfuricans]|uniref:Glutamate-cysteine ligase family 2(GCS2) n=2 Tax=Halapricum desulfuricans TaxID=2841257 RepID=A0A897N2U8_9EURY|nr:glutamate-cysteine ligase family protein [Halapricum desulfuricans]QSG08730.1 Glutamate-cysteine ligase family 2(GCS2) [Halapricum desulfuricans]